MLDCTVLKNVSSKLNYYMALSIMIRWTTIVSLGLVFQKILENYFNFHQK